MSLPLALLLVAAATSPPGAEPRSATLEQRISEAATAALADGPPRTRHLREDGSPIYTNRLALETSPYLRQHAHNPVDWYAWGAEAFAAAERLDRPIFLSVGYSTCHWCHVMEHESFDDVETARILNRDFIAIKVDREERPDLDDIYMTAVRLTAGRGGWPMSVFLTSEGRPFFGGTYFPRDRFQQVLERVKVLWRSDRGRILRFAEQLSGRIAEITTAAGTSRQLDESVFSAAVDAVLARHDSEYGGFGTAPKFPHETELLFLADAASRTGHAAASEALLRSLDGMAAGGVHDQVGGGFHRYSVDRQWLVPHFEKMLYNQAFMARAYLAGYRRSGELWHAWVAKRILDAALRDFQAPDGSFYSATDADSEGEEGTYFVWTPSEIRQVLGPDDAAFAIDLFGVTEEGNFEGRNVLHLARDPRQLARDAKRPLVELLQRIERVTATLHARRIERIPPLRDDKRIAAWNGMMVAALAEAATTLGEARYLEEARRAADSTWRGHWVDGALWRIRLGEKRSTPALQEDFAYLVEGFVELADAGGGEVWLERAEALTEPLIRDFWDPDGGGFFLSPAGEEIGRFTRPKSPADGATPSGNAVAARAMGRLARRNGDGRTADHHQATLAAFASAAVENPTAHTYLLLAAREAAAGEIGTLEHSSGGVVRARLEATSPRGGGDPEIVVHLRLRDGWHIQSDRPHDDALVPTELFGDGRSTDLQVISYPEARSLSVAFEEEPLSVFTGEFEIRARLAIEDAGTGSTTGASPWVGLRVQPCDDRACLRPEVLKLEMSRPLIRSASPQKRPSRR